MAHTSMAVQSTLLFSTPKACLLDTDVLIDYLRGYPGAQDLFSMLSSDYAVSVVSVAELHVGVREGNERKSLGALSVLLN